MSYERKSLQYMISLILCYFLLSMWSVLKDTKSHVPTIGRSCGNTTRPRMTHLAFTAGLGDICNLTTAPYRASNHPYDLILAEIQVT